jgi:ABC-type polysaccharide/polyol phosphate transport system ATPase subunit
MARIELKNVTVDIPLLGGDDSNIKGRIVRRLKRSPKRDEAIRALNDINLDLKDGDRIGLVGSNGAGKTTMLRVMAGIYTPTSGTSFIEGKVASLFDAGMGIDLGATGYDNITLRGMFLGESRDAMDGRVEEIAEFSGLGERLHHPVSTYSAGMMARLGFSIATSLDPEILLVDEGIGTADAEFTARARERLEEFMGRAGILVLASHSPILLGQFCDQAVLLEKGTIVERGSTDQILALQSAAKKR